MLQNKKADKFAPMIFPKGDEQVYHVENAMTDRNEFYQNRHLPEDMTVKEAAHDELPQIQYC